MWDDLVAAWNAMGRSGTSWDDLGRLRPLQRAYRGRTTTKMTEGVDGVDPSDVTTPLQFTERLSEVHVRAGELPYGELAKRTGLSKSTVQRALSGGRLPTPPVLGALLKTFDVSEPARERWFVVRRNVERRGPDDHDQPAALPQSDDPADTGTPEDTEMQTDIPSDTDTPAGDGADQGDDGIRPMAAPAQGRSRTEARSRRWLAVGAAALVLATVFVLTTRSAQPPSASHPSVPPTLGCEPTSCSVAGERVTVSGQLGDKPSADHEAYVLIRVDNVNRWYLGPAILADDTGRWTAAVAIGNPIPQEKDRHFTICSYLLASSAVPDLTTKLVAHGTEGVSVDELPADHKELACVKVVRLKNT